MKRSNLTLALLPLALIVMVGCGNESRAEREPSTPAAAAIEQTAQVKQAPRAPDYGKVLVTNRLDIDFSKYLRSRSSSSAPTAASPARRCSRS